MHTLSRDFLHSPVMIFLVNYMPPKVKNARESRELQMQFLPFSGIVAESTKGHQQRGSLPVQSEG